MPAVVWKQRITLSLWEALLAGGLTGFGCALGVHYTMGYLTLSHIAPAWIGAIIYLTGTVCLYPSEHFRFTRPGLGR